MLHLRCLVLVSLFGGLAGCDSLLNRPGGDFAVTVRTGTPLVVTQRVEPVELVFEVTGCSDFDTSIGTVTTGGSVSVALEPVRRADGLYVAKVPVQALAVEDRCQSTADAPLSSSKRLTVVCRDQHREAETSVDVSYAATFKSFYGGRGPVDSVFPGRDPGTFFTVGSGYLTYFSDRNRSKSDAVTAVEASTRPLLVQRGSTVYLWAGCPLDECGNVKIVETPTVTSFTGATYLIPFEFDEKTGTLDRASAAIAVPATVRAMTALPSGNLALVSELADAVLLTTVSGRTVSRVQQFDGEGRPTDFARLGDALVFLTTTKGDAAVRMRASDGIALADYPLEGAGPITFLSLAPSGNQWVYVRSGEVRLGGLGADGKTAATRTLDTQVGGDDHVGATWLGSHVGLWNLRQAQRPELHGRSQALPPVTITLAEVRGRSTYARTLLGLEDKVAVVTATGVEVFDVAGHSLGGADPFGSPCGLPNYFGGEVTVLDGDTIAVGGTNNVSLFRP